MNNKGSVDKNQLKEFCPDLANDLVVLLNAAVIAQLNAMHKIVIGWINEHNIDPKSSSLKVLLIGTRTVRQKNFQPTYFERLLGIEGKENIDYIEELFNNELKDTSLLSTCFCDEELSVTFFDDQARMHRDLLMNDHIEE